LTPIKGEFNMSLFVSLATVLALTNPVQSTQRGDDQGDLGRLQGTWKVVRAEANGKPAPAEIVERDSGTYTFEGDKVTIRERGTKRGVAQVSLDSGRQPKTIDMKDLEGQENHRTIHAIYEIRGKTLRICMGTKGERPGDFSGTGDAVLFEFEHADPVKP
jgi:uncharacterized protein (TIGR03067 family)